jgi:hypothetical protein
VGEVPAADLPGEIVRLSPGEVIADVLPWTWVSFVVAACSGALLFSSNATHYWGTVPFRAKMLVLALAGLNMVLFHTTTFRSIDVWDRGKHTPLAAKVSGGVSLGLWIGVVSLGRWIGFV